MTVIRSVFMLRKENKLEHKVEQSLCADIITFNNLPSIPFTRGGPLMNKSFQNHFSSNMSSNNDIAK